MTKRKLASRKFNEYELSDAIEAPIEKKIIRNIIYVVSLSISSLLLWSVFSEVEEVAKAPGTVVPLGHRQVIQSQAGGTISELKVEEGDVVKKGDVLANFIAIDSESAKEELISQRVNLLMTIERFNAFSQGREADFSEFHAQHPELVLKQRQSLSAMTAELEAIKSLSKSDVAKANAEYRAVQSEIPTLERQVNSSSKTLRIMTKLLKTGSVSKVRYFEAQEKHNAYLRELTALKGKKKLLSKTVENLKAQLNQKQKTILKEIGSQNTDAQGQLMVIEARLKASNSNVSQNTIIAPVDGVVQSLPSSTIGSVVLPGGTVAVIVPTTKTALLEAKLSTRDIGFVELGQVVRIKIDAFDYSRYGALDGVIKKISPSTSTDERGGVFYKIEVSIEKPYFDNNQHRLLLIPGMTGEADIVTGKKSIFAYLWKPVFTNVSSAFGER